jgi:hypothetical protein
MASNGLSHPLFAAKIDLPVGDGNPFSRWGDRGGNHRANSVWKLR